MIDSTNTVHIDGTIIDHDKILNSFKLDSSDSFTRWVVRPLALLTAIGMGVAMFFASIFLIMLSLAMLPLAVLSIWALKKKLERENTTTDSVATTQE